MGEQRETIQLPREHVELVVVEVNLPFGGCQVSIRCRCQDPVVEAAKHSGDTWTL